MAENSLKRVLPDDSLHNGETAQKKIRSNNGSPAPAPGASAANKPDVSKIMADVRISLFHPFPFRSNLGSRDLSRKHPLCGRVSRSNIPPQIDKSDREFHQARARAAAVAARLKAGTNGVTTAPQVSPSGTASSASNSKLEQIKARVAATMAKTSGVSEQRTVSPLPPTARGGLGTQLHPALMENSALEFRPSKGKQAVQQKADQTSKSGKAKKQLDLSLPDPTVTRTQPYFDASLGSHTATLKARNRRDLAFNTKGKYIQQGAALRRQRALEEVGFSHSTYSKVISQLGSK